ncbi:MAG: Nif3-like dinuclear metal center hexameric protein [Clostridia bacterium]|nr:Nif3-like dinuclear metal center hexameric protein [Clostridia bacterium]
MTVKDVYDLIDGYAPFSSQCEWDNSGILLGDADADVKGVLVALDVTNYEAKLAVERGANLIVAHHPLIFHPLKRIEYDSLVSFLIRSGIHVIAAHTNLDKAPGGVNDALCEALGFSFEKVTDAGDGFLNIASFPDSLSANEVAALLKARLSGAVSYIDDGKPVRKAALCGGDGGSFLQDADSLGCDALITGEAGYHDFLDAKTLGVSLFAAGHYETEAPVMTALRKTIKNAFPDIPVTVSDRKNSILTVL